MEVDMPLRKESEAKIKYLNNFDKNHKLPLANLGKNR